MKKSEFETKLIVGIASHRLALLKELSNRNLFYSNAMYEPEDIEKVYLLELCDYHFILRSDLIFDHPTERFFYVTKEKFEYEEDIIKETLLILRRTERKVYDIFSKLKLRGFYTRNEFIRSLLKLMPRLEWSNNLIRERSSGKVFITIKRDILHLMYQDGKAGNFLDLAKKDLNEKVLFQCAELIKAAFKYEGL
jgi:hypothetical protein